MIASSPLALLAVDVRRFAIIALLTACGGDDVAPLTAEELLDPAACAGCHPDQYRQWSGSSHAFAADDPVFIAMNARYQRDTGGAYPSDCAGCHAPVALASGAGDGADPAALPANLRGVTCYACHAVIEADPAGHLLRFTGEPAMGGALADSVGTGAHRSTYAPLFDRAEWSSTDLCGVCHDFDSRAGAHAHRTLTEWTESLFSDTFSRSFLTCSSCHMTGSDGPIATGDVPERRRHDHGFPGVDVALIDWPERDAQRAAIEADLAPAILARVCLDTDLRPEVTLDNVMAGHMWPSGDAFTRRAWAELVVERGGETVYQSDEWELRDQLQDAEGQPVLFSWQATEAVPALLPPAVTADPNDPRFFHAVTRTYPALANIPDRMTLRVRIRPIGADVIDALVAGGDLDAAIGDAVPTFTLEGTTVEWTGEPGSCAQ